MRVAVVLVSFSIGGAEKRYYNLIRHLAVHKKWEITIYINHSLHEALRQMLGTLPRNCKVVYVYRGLGAACFDRLDFFIYGASWNRLIPRALRRYVHFGIYRFRHLMLKFFGRSCWPQTEDNFDVIHWLFLKPPGRKYRLGPGVVYSIFSTAIRQIARKTNVFRKAVDNAVCFDILSPDLREGILEVTQGAGADRMLASPCSFIDYSDTRIGKKKNMVAFSGRLHPIKNPFLFVEAIGIICEKRDDVEFVIMGHGPLEAEVRARVEELGVMDRVRVGHESNPAGILSQAMVFVSLQNINNYPSQALIEAMACGCAVVASDEGETHLLVNNDTGVLVSLSSDEVADAVIQMIDNPDRTQDLGRAGRELVTQSHTVARYAEHLQEVYQLAIKTKDCLSGKVSPSYSQSAE